MTAVSPEVAERLRRRYPPPLVPRAVKVVLIAVGVAIAMAWLIWTATVQSTPAVSAQVAAYTVKSSTTIAVTFTVDRRDPSRPVSCQVIAQSADFQTVGEQQVPVEATEAKVVDVDIDLTTLRQATSASVKGCTLR
ncbi:MAG TPA: DUF4307 domain-containing protein [Propionibacteriaceae bacterium]